MALEQRLQLKLTQKLVMTPTLQQAIKLLQLSRLELEQALEQELEVNPLLELTEESPAEEAAAASQANPSDEAGSPREEQADAASSEVFGEVEIEALFSNYLHDAPAVAATWQDEEDAPLENSPGPEPSLFDALCEQLRFLDVPQVLETACEYVIGNLDGDGYLRAPEEDLAEQLGVGIAVVERAVAVVQELDPPGIGARSLRECFLLQLRRAGSTASDSPAAPLAIRVVGEAFEDLLNQRWEKLEQRFGVGLDEVRGVIELLKTLEVHPGAQLGPSDNAAVEPDVMVTKVDGEWRVSQNDDGMPRLRLSPRYLSLLKSRSLDSDASGFVRERMRAALWFLRSVEQRKNTIIKVSEAIVRRQQEFLEKGLHQLRPLVLRDIADDIGMHESTVSRVVANKYMATPRGVFPLKFFFHSSISHAVHGDISSVVVKQRIRDLIESEEDQRPLSDARVARQLNRLGIRIARRTVAKYREEMGIPSSEQRRRVLR